MGNEVDEQINDMVIETGSNEEVIDDSSVKITMSGQEYEVPTAVAEAINAERQGMDRKLGENSEELGELRKYQRDSIANQGYHTPAEQAPPVEGYDYETAIYEDANVAINHLKNEIREEIRNEYVQDQTQRESGTRFWDSFYREHQDLGRDDIRADVQRRVMDELPKYANLPDNAATRARMADDTRAYFLGIAKNFGGGGNNGTNNYSERTGNNGSNNTTAKEDTFVRRTTSEIIKGNRKKKRQALIDNK